MARGLKKASTLWKSLIFGTAATFVLSFVMIDLLRIEITQASVLQLPEPNQLLNISKEYSLPVLKGLKLNENDPLQVSFIIDALDQGNVKTQEAQKLVNYFMAALTVPEEQLWVNLSPYENDRIMDDNLAITDLGKEFLAQDYVLKQFSSSMTYPDSSLGKEFWAKAQEKMSEFDQNAHVDINTFNKIWIVPGKVKVLENGYTAVISESSLKTMMEEDYLARDANKDSLLTNASTYDPLNAQNISKTSSELMREVILPEIENEVNQGKHFANLRQVYNSIILAMWFKQKFKDSFYKHYFDQAKLEGIDIEDKDVKEKIYNLYTEAFKKGVYDYIGKAVNPLTKEKQKRRYFSGGMNMAQSSSLVLQNTEQVKPSDLLGYLKGELYAFKTRWRQDDIENYDSQEIAKKGKSIEASYKRSLKNVDTYQRMISRKDVRVFQNGVKQYALSDNSNYFFEYDSRDGTLKRTKRPARFPKTNDHQIVDAFLFKLFNKSEVLAARDKQKAQLDAQVELFDAIKNEHKDNKEKLAELAQVRKDFWTGMVSDAVLSGKKVFSGIKKSSQATYRLMEKFSNAHEKFFERSDQILIDTTNILMVKLSESETKEQQQDLEVKLEVVEEVRERMEQADAFAKSLKPIGLMAENEIKEAIATNQEGISQEVIDYLASDFDSVAKVIEEKEAEELITDISQMFDQGLESFEQEFDQNKAKIKSLSEELDNVVSDVQLQIIDEAMGLSYTEGNSPADRLQELGSEIAELESRVPGLAEMDALIAHAQTSVESLPDNIDEVYSQQSVKDFRMSLQGKAQNEMTYMTLGQELIASTFKKVVLGQELAQDLAKLNILKLAAAQANIGYFEMMYRGPIETIASFNEMKNKQGSADYKQYMYDNIKSLNAGLSEIFESVGENAVMAQSMVIADGLDRIMKNSNLDIDGIIYTLKLKKQAGGSEKIEDIVSRVEAMDKIPVLKELNDVGAMVDFLTARMYTTQYKASEALDELSAYAEQGLDPLAEQAEQREALAAKFDEGVENINTKEDSGDLIITSVAPDSSTETISLWQTKIAETEKVLEKATQISDQTSDEFVSLKESFENHLDPVLTAMATQSSSVDYGGIDMAGIDIEIDGSSSALAYIPFDIVNFKGFKVTAISLNKVENNSQLLAML